MTIYIVECIANHAFYITVNCFTGLLGNSCAATAPCHCMPWLLRYKSIYIYIYRYSGMCVFTFLYANVSKTTLALQLRKNLFASYVHCIMEVLEHLLRCLLFVHHFPNQPFHFFSLKMVNSIDSRLVSGCLNQNKRV